MLRLYLQFTNNNCIFFFIVTSNNFVCSLGTGQMRREDLGNLNCMLIFLGLKDPSESWKLTKLCWKNILWLIDLTLQSIFFFCNFKSFKGNKRACSTFRHNKNYQKWCPSFFPWHCVNLVLYYKYICIWSSSRFK